MLLCCPTFAIWKFKTSNQHCYMPPARHLKPIFVGIAIIMFHPTRFFLPRYTFNLPLSLPLPSLLFIELCVKTVFDVESDEPLPQADVVVAADVLYNKELAIEIGKRCYEVLSINTDKVHRPSLIVTDSQRFHGTDFLTELNSKLEAASANGKEMQTRSSVSNVQWDERMLEDVITSGKLHTR